jgi:hypothetical protein
MLLLPMPKERAMNRRALHQAAGLTLIAWYLMAPKVIYYSKMRVPAGFTKWATCCSTSDGNSDLSSWITVGSYKNAVECEAARMRLDPNRGQFHGSGMTEAAKQDPKGFEWAKQKAIEEADCFAGDDPRLKRN